MLAIVVLTGILFLGLTIAVAWRFFALRSKGYPALMRPLPEEDGRNWRHGVLVYSAVSARMYKLRSLKPDSDLILTRLGTTIESRRGTTDRERSIIEDDVHIVVVKHRDRQYELALDEQGDTALVAWLESAPSARRVRARRKS